MNFLVYNSWKRTNINWLYTKHPGKAFGIFIFDAMLNLRSIYNPRHKKPISIYPCCVYIGTPKTAKTASPIRKTHRKHSHTHTTRIHKSNILISLKPFRHRTISPAYSKSNPYSRQRDIRDREKSFLFLNLL